MGGCGRRATVGKKERGINKTERQVNVFPLACDVLYLDARPTDADDKAACACGISRVPPEE